jgi:succinate dehydrogenase/fumarate reductase cytochrome b subunit
MTEAKVRKLHRHLGIVLVGFLALQGVTGLLLAWGDLTKVETLSQLAGAIHFGWNPWGSVYRILLSLATAAQGLTGIAIYLWIRGRMQKG